MEMLEFRNIVDNERESKGIIRLYATLEYIYRKVLKYLFPWVKHDDENRVNEDFTINNKIEILGNDEQIEKESINNNIALIILMSELLDRQ
jgi:hypothetical protein